MQHYQKKGKKMSSAIYQREDILQIEQDAQDQGLDLINEASDALVRWATKTLPTPAKILVLAGKGHNGAEALFAASKLSSLGFTVSACAIFAPATHYTKKLWQNKQQIPPQIKVAIKDLSAEYIAHFDLIIDGIFGIGLNQEVRGNLKLLFERINQAAKRVVAIDIPSGLDALTGTVRGAAIKANTTMTFLTPKLGLYTAAGADFSGEIILLPLSVNPIVYENIRPIAQIMQPNFSRLKLPHNSNKSSFGGVQVFGGSKGMLGAIVMASRAAMSLGAGKVWLSPISKMPKVDWLYPEIMPHSIKIHPDATVLICGPGLGTSKIARTLLSKVLKSKRALILDADALNLISTDGKLQATLNKRQNPTILTPHPSEAARLLRCNTETIQANRLEAVYLLRQKFNAVILLKGSGSLTIAADHTVFLCNKGNPSLANGGQGDVLSGAIGAFLAQGLSDIGALNAAVYLHAKAADIYVQEQGLIGLRASISIERMLMLLNQKIGA